MKHDKNRRGKKGTVCKKACKWEEEESKERRWEHCNRKQEYRERLKDNKLKGIWKLKQMANENQVAFFMMFLYLTMFVALAQKWKKGKDISLVFLAGLEVDNMPLENYFSMFPFKVLQLPFLS